MKTPHRPLKLSRAGRRALIPFMGRRIRYRRPTESDLLDFKQINGPHGHGDNKQHFRQAIREAFGKPIQRLTLREYQQWCSRGFERKKYLGPVWDLLTPAEKRIISRFNELALTFPGDFATPADFHAACAERLSRYFCRRIKLPPPAPTIKQ